MTHFNDFRSNDPEIAQLQDEVARLKRRNDDIFIIGTVAFVWVAVSIAGIRALANKKQNVVTHIHVPNNQPETTFINNGQPE